ncbi:hypothetical protein CJF32_00002500 [Rutstroemia sp. NJR-2017a WRK4]|nr:hypothetical protein CJF32_00002500 [Rutstroemia sp. NJR-2017a WRK4]
MDCLPIPFFCIQCGTDQNPCHIKVVGPTLGFAVGLASAPNAKKSQMLTNPSQIVCWPASIFVGCCATETGKKCTRGYQWFGIQRYTILALLDYMAEK